MPKLTTKQPGVKQLRQPLPAEPETSGQHHYITGASKGLATLEQAGAADSLKMAASQQYGANVPRTGLRSPSKGV